MGESLCLCVGGGRCRGDLVCMVVISLKTELESVGVEERAS